MFMAWKNYEVYFMNLLSVLIVTAKKLKMHLIHEVKGSLLFPFYNKRDRYSETICHHPLEKNHGIKEPIGFKLIFKILAAPEYSDF